MPVLLRKFEHFTRNITLHDDRARTKKMNHQKANRLLLLHRVFFGCIMNEVYKFCENNCSCENVKDEAVSKWILRLVY